MSFDANRKQLKVLNSQLKMNFFADYTKRYQEIILNFPEDMNKKSFDFKDLKRKERDRTMRYLRAYFDLCSEEFHLWQEGLIDESVWSVWEGGMKFAFSNQAIRKAWDIIFPDTRYNPDFIAFVEREMKK